MTRAIMLILMLSWASSVWAAMYYRYQNEQGQVVISQSIPAKYVPNGYEILNANGRVIEVIPRALTQEELDAIAAEQKREQARAEQRERDQKLLSIFSSPEDASRALGRKLEAIDVYINVTKGNILKLQNEYNQAQAQAAEKERAGDEVPSYILEKMQSFSRQITQAEQAIVRKEEEKEQIRAEYQKDINRLRELMDEKENAMQNGG